MLYSGNATPTSFVGSITTAVGQAFTVADATGWPEGDEFVVLLDQGLTTAEKVVCTRSGTTFTTTVRGYDGTAAHPHTDSSVTHVVAAVRLNGKFSDGSATFPSISFEKDSDTGIYRSAADILALAVGGAKSLELGAGDVSMWFAGVRTHAFQVGQAFGPDGTAASPAMAFLADPDTGLYRVSANEVGVALGGVAEYSFYGNAAYGFSPFQDNARPLGAPDRRWTNIHMADGTAAAPAYTFGADPDTGLYRITVNEIGFTTGGTFAGRIAGSQIQMDATDSAVLPTYSFNGDTDTGIYRGGVDFLNFAAGGTGIFFASTGANGVSPVADNLTSLGNSARRWKDIYAVNGTINTSDETQKNSVEDTPLGLAFVRALRPIRFRFTDGTRPHDGFGAQQVREALDALGVEDAAAYVDPAVEADRRENPYKAKKPSPKFLKDYLPDEPDTDDNGVQKEYKRAVKATKSQAQEEWDKAREAFDAETEAMRNAPKGLRYNELIPPLYRAIQEQQDIIEQQQATIEDLVARIGAIEAAQ